MNDTEVRKVYETLEKIRRIESDINKDRIRQANNTIDCYVTALGQVSEVLKTLVKNYEPIIFDEDEAEGEVEE